MDHVNFVNGREYPAATFRRWFSDQQDGAKGFSSLTAFEVKADGTGGAYTVAPGTAFAPDRTDQETVPGLYQIVMDSPKAGTFAGDQKFLWLLPLDAVEFPDEGDAGDTNPVQLIKTAGNVAPSPRALLLCSYENGRIVDQRWTGSQFVVTRSGPGRLGAPGSDVPSEALSRFSLGTQYTDLATGIRYVRKAMTGAATDWYRDRGSTGKTGPQGPQGNQGPQGRQGDKGELGDLTNPGYASDALFKASVTVQGVLAAGSVNDVAAALASNTSALTAKADASRLTSEVTRLEGLISNMAGKVSPGVAARSNGIRRGQHSNEVIPWDYQNSLRLNGFTTNGAKTEFVCRSPGTYLISVTASTSTDQSSNGTRIHINLNGRDQYRGSFATTGGRPSCGVRVTLYEGDEIDISFTSNTSMSLTNEETFLSITKIG